MGAHAKGERRMEKKEEKEPQTIVEAEKTAPVDEIPADTTPIDTTAIEQPMPEEPEIKVKNPRMEKVLELKREAERQSELEEIRTKRIHKEQEYIDHMIVSVEANMKNSEEGRQYNEEFERKIREQVYKMHGISEDKRNGMERYRAAYYQGAAFALFFLSVLLVVLCGILHGFASEVCLFMAFFTAIEGTLLTNGKKCVALFDTVIRILYLLLFPAMMVIFVCYELGFKEYGLLCPIFTAAGLIILCIGSISYFVYDPYRQDRKDRRRAENYLRDMERAAQKDVELREKALAKLRKKQEKAAKKEERRKQKLKQS